MNFKRKHHKAIANILSKFNAGYLQQHNILFGGGTRIALELDEYRESIDIDFLCVGAGSFRAVRSQVLSNSLGELLSANEKLIFTREIRADRDAVRTFIGGFEHPIKLEFIHFDHSALQRDNRQIFPVPCIDKNSCLLTKLLANADRYSSADKKDIIDLCMMVHNWGDIPKGVWEKADSEYGLAVVKSGLQQALQDFKEHPDQVVSIATKVLGMERLLAKKMVYEYAPEFMKSLSKMG